MNQSQFLTMGFDFASHWLKNWREIFKPITKRSNRVITFHSHLKTDLQSNISSTPSKEILLQLLLISSLDNAVRVNVTQCLF